MYIKNFIEIQGSEHPWLDLDQCLGTGSWSQPNKLCKCTQFAYFKSYNERMVRILVLDLFLKKRQQGEGTKMSHNENFLKIFKTFEMRHKCFWNGPIDT